MYRWYISMCLFLFAQAAASQQPVFQWVKGLYKNNAYNYDVYNNGRTVGVDAQGNIYSAGFFSHDIDMDPGAGVSNLTAGGYLSNGIYISKLDADGNFVWGKQIPVLVEWSAIELKVDRDGNVYLGACFGEQADMDPGPGVFMMTPIGAKDAFVVKLNSEGNLVWAKQFGGPGDTVPAVYALDLDKNNNVIVCGIFNNTVDFDPGPGTYNLTSNGLKPFIVKLTNNGDLLWAKQFVGNASSFGGSAISDVKCDSKGNLCLTGGFVGNCDFDPGAGVYNMTSSPGSSQDGYVAKLDPDGNFIWAKQFVSTVNQNNYYLFSQGIDVDGSDNIVITGTFMGTRDFDPGPGIYTLSTVKYEDCFILKLTAQGDFVWAKRIGNDESDGGNDVVVDSDNNVYVAGSFASGTDLDPGPGDYRVTSNYYGESALIKLDANGNFLYAAPCLSISYGSSLFRRMVIDPAKNIYITGYFYGEMDFDPGPNVYSYTGNGYTPFVYKLAPCAHLTRSVLNISDCDSYTLNNVRFDSTGTYIQTIPNSYGCDSVITLNLTITKKFTQQTKTICEGESFFAAGTNQTTAGTYRDSLKTWQGCDSIVTTNLIVNPKPLPDLGKDRDLCGNTQLDITPGLFTSYLWQDMSTAANFKINSAGTYWVKVTNNFNCTATDTMVLQTLLAAPSNFLKEKDSICSYESLELVPGNAYLKYEWSTGASERKLTIQKPGTYWLKVTDKDGCSGNDTITVYQKNCLTGFFCPTAFSPNKDGKNDVFKPMLFGKVRNYKLVIYNQWGQIIFKSSDATKGWDGSVNRITQDSNVFVWICNYQFEGEKEKTERGTVMLIR
jgi:gliding motility-associated-like protein